MIKTLTAHGNSAALIIDNALLEIVTDGENLIISPVRGDSRHDRVAKTLEKVNARHGKTLKKLAD